MASTPPVEAHPSRPEPPQPLEQGRALRGPYALLLEGLDRLLSEPLRRTSSADLTRARLTVGATCFLLLFTLLYVASGLFTSLPEPVLLFMVVPILGYVGILVLARRASSIRAPALLLCVLVTLGLVGGVFSMKVPAGGTHAVNMLLPALSVYLLGSRWGLTITLFLCAALGVCFPLYLDTLPDFEPDPQLWSNYLFAALSFLGAWGLGTLHSAARDEAQARLERTLEELRDSEGKLSSVFESTDDTVCSIDLQGRLLTANTALKKMYRRRFGTEPTVGQPFFIPTDPEFMRRWEDRMTQVLSGERLRLEETYILGEEHFVMDVRISPIRGAGDRITGLTIFARDVTARKQAEARLGEMHRTLVDVSRQAGMAEIATGVLHNVGNTLNSVNISTGLVIDQLRKSRVTGLGKATELLREHSHELGTFLTTDPQGQKLPAYLIALSGQLQQERDSMLQEMRSLSDSVDHIKSIVSMQQKHARSAGTVEPIQVAPLIDEALRLHAVSFERLGISIRREYTDAPSILVDRHKLLQILVNLLSNARHALVDSEQQDKRLTIRVRPTQEGRSLLIEVADNGVGIAPENLARMFTQGFTTKKTGHGFGLHISALAATEMRGQLSCASPGLGQGATFALVLPIGDEAPAG